VNHDVEEELHQLTDISPLVYLQITFSSASLSKKKKNSQTTKALIFAFGSISTSLDFSKML
jgi:hypothetical protein